MLQGASGLASDPVGGGYWHDKAIVTSVLTPLATQA